VGCSKFSLFENSGVHDHEHRLGVHIDYELLYYDVSWIVMCDLVDLSVIVCDFCVFAQSNVIVFDDITFDFLYKSGGM